MEERIFVDKSPVPDAALVRERLGKAAPWFERFVEFAEADGWKGSWKYHNKRYGWTWKAERKKESLYWMAPAVGGVVFGLSLRKSEKEAVLGGDFPETVRKPVRIAKEFPEGYAAQWFVHDGRSFDDAFTVARLVAGMR
ncbi:MAG TPA: DUF3788 family protein [Spirochaetales bacterium]|nr:DUF3788 family protein [Spirochaetales bacterium]